MKFFCVVFFISSNVVSYRRSYISNDKDADRFILLVSRFVISIVFLIVRPNMVTILSTIFTFLSIYFLHIEKRYITAIEKY
mgnify:CR=1 FL=1